VAPSAPDDVALGRHLTWHDATFDRLNVLRAVAKTATQGLTYEQIQARSDEFLASDEIVEIGPERWTTPEMLAIEADAQQRAASGPRCAAVPLDVIDAAIAERPSISAEQAHAVRAITVTDAPIAVMVGHAGAGKTFTLDAAREGRRRAGLRPRGMALSARAAGELQAGSGIESQTIASFFGELDDGLRLTGHELLVVDEAGMVGARGLHRLLVATTEAGAKLVLVGDPKQLAEIEAGGLFGVLARHFAIAELTENRRLCVPAQAATAHALRNGDVDGALLRLHRAGGLTVDDNADLLRSKIAEDWFLEHNDGKHVVMLALHRSDLADLNHRVRRLLHRHGQLGDWVMTVGDTDLGVGDRVLALRNNRRIGITNGTQATISGVDDGHLQVETDDGRRLAVPAEYAAAGHLTHGYAMTVDKAPGMSCDVSLVLGDDSLYVEAGYTSIARGRFRNHVYAVAGPDADDPVAEIRRALNRSVAKQAAIEQLELGL
jgi:ATP-dependent exoDNAse (exonuclease V) alpha subunit